MPIRPTRIERSASELDEHETSVETRLLHRFDRRGCLARDTSAFAANCGLVQSRCTSDRLTSSQQFRHSGWRHRRAQVMRALVRTSQSLQRRDRFRLCGSSVYVCASEADPDRYRLVGNYCKDRLCVPCSVARARWVADAIASAMTDDRHRLVTLTLRHRREPLVDTLRRLVVAFRSLRQTRLWRECVAGGIATIEVTRNLATRTWHVHLHAVVHGKYLASRALSKQWLAITKDSMVVDVRCVTDQAKAAQYVAKYVAKGLDPTKLGNDDNYDELLVALKGLRTIITFGDWYRVRLRPSKPTSDVLLVASLDEILRGYRLREASSTAILASIVKTTLDVSPLEYAMPPPR